MFLFVAITGAPILAQESEEAEHHFHRNDIGLFVGGMTPLEHTEQTSFAFGIDYERRLTRTIGAGLLVDFVVGDHERASLVAAMAAYRPIEPLRLALGPGFEMVQEEETHNGTTETHYKTFFVVAMGPPTPSHSAVWR